MTPRGLRCGTKKTWARFTRQERGRARCRRRDGIVRCVGLPTSLHASRQTSSRLRWHSWNNWARTGNGHPGRVTQRVGKSGIERSGSRRRGFFVLVRVGGRWFSFPPCLIQSADGVFEVLGVVGDREFLMGSDHHHQIVAARPVGAMESERLSNEPFEPIPTNRIPASSADREPQAEMLDLIWDRIDQERAGLETSPCGMDFGEGASPLQSIVRAEGESERRHGVTIPPVHVGIHASIGFGSGRR